MMEVYEYNFRDEYLLVTKDKVSGKYYGTFKRDGEIYPPVNDSIGPIPLFKMIRWVRDWTGLYEITFDE